MKLKNLLLTTLIVTTFGVVKAGPEPDIPETQEIPERNHGEDPNRKRMSARHDGISFRYDYLNKSCVFSNFGPSTSLSVTITDWEGNSGFGFVSIDRPVWQIDLPTGEYFVSCTSDTGTTSKASSIYEKIRFKTEV